MELYAAMTTTPTTRFYRPDPVPSEVLHRILDAARHAPSGGNRQGWRVVVVTDAALRRKLRDLYLPPWREYVERLVARAGGRRSRSLERSDEFAEHLHDVPVHLVVCVDVGALTITDDELGRPSIVGGASIYPFVQNILLGCRNEGLGAAITTMLCRREPEVKDLLAIPPEYAMACLLAVGHADEDRRPSKISRRDVSEIAFRDTFDGGPFEA